MAGLSGTAMLLKSIVGQETFDQIQNLANDGTLAKIVAFAENGEAIRQTLERLEKKFDAFNSAEIPKFAVELDGGTAVPPGSGSVARDIAPGSGAGSSEAVG